MHKRAERRWTVVVVPHGSGQSRALGVSHTLLKSLLGLASAVTLVFAGLAAAALIRGVGITRNRMLAHENRVLLDEVQRMRNSETALRDSLVTMARRDQGLRLLAGLSVLDSAVQQGGIGGPRGEWPERDSLIAVGDHGAQALAARVDLDVLERRAGILLTSVGQAYESLSSHWARFAVTPSIMPLHGRVSSVFSALRFDPVVRVVRPHEGIDVAAPLGSAIAATAAGVVTDVKWENGYGNLLTIDHGSGIVTRYAHCSKILVARGQHVKRGEKVALVGSTGESTGPHVHYEVWVNGKPVDPKTFVMPEDAIAD